MSKTNIAWYTQFCPVLAESGWYETGVMRYGDVYFRNRINSDPKYEIQVGIQVFPTYWKYIGTVSTWSYSFGINVFPPDITAPWDEVKAYYLKYGEIAYKEWKEEKKRKLSELTSVIQEEDSYE